MIFVFNCILSGCTVRVFVPKYEIMVRGEVDKREEAPVIMFYLSNSTDGLRRARTISSFLLCITLLASCLMACLLSNTTSLSALLWLEEVKGRSQRNSVRKFKSKIKTLLIY